MKWWLGSRTRDAWLEAARRCGLTYSDPRFLSRRSIWGRRSGLEVVVQETRGRGAAGRLGVHITIGWPGRLGFRLARRSGLRLNQPRSGVVTGDPTFDDEYEPAGDEAVIRALLDEQTRGELRRAVGDDLLITEEGLRLELRQRVGDAESLTELISGCLHLATRLSLRSEELPARLQRNAARDPLPAVRAHNLRLLLERFPEATEAHAAIRAGMSDPAPELRLGAARARGGTQASACLAALVCSAEVPEPLRAEALRALSIAATDASAEALPLAREALASNQVLLQLAALEVLRAHGGPEDEPALLAALEAGGDELEIAASEALGEVGTLRAVMPLLRAARTLLPRRARTAARRAIRRIQERHATAATGGLSLVPEGGPPGALSVLPDEDDDPKPKRS